MSSRRTRAPFVGTLQGLAQFCLEIGGPLFALRGGGLLAREGHRDEEDGEEDSKCFEKKRFHKKPVLNGRECFGIRQANRGDEFSLPKRRLFG